MIFDLLKPTTLDLKKQLEDQHERLNFPTLWHKTCVEVAINLLDRGLISEEACGEACELADAGLDHALEVEVTWPREWDVTLCYSLICREDGEVWAECSGNAFERDQLGSHPVGKFTRMREGRIYVTDMFKERIFGVFVTGTTAELEGKHYEMVLRGRWDGQKVVPITDQGMQS